MAFELDIYTANITFRQGDSGDFTLGGIPTDKNYIAYWAGRDNKRNIILELSAVPDENGDVTFIFTPSDTNKFSVPSGMKKKIYYWDVKICCEEEGYEDTVVIGVNKTINDVNKLIVYPLTVEGTLNDQ